MWKTGLIIGVACKLHNFNIDNGYRTDFDFIPLHDENAVEGQPFVNIQNNLHTDVQLTRSRNRTVNDNRREQIKDILRRRGYTRPRV